MAPSIWPPTYSGTCDQAKPPRCAAAIARVTAGLRCAPLYLATQNTPTKTARPQPQAMTIQPEPWPLVFCNTTLATTPLPSKMRMAVPISSARKGDMLRASWVQRNLPDRGVARSGDRATTQAHYCSSEPRTQRSGVSGMRPLTPLRCVRGSDKICISGSDKKEDHRDQPSERGAYCGIGGGC